MKSQDTVSVVEEVYAKYSSLLQESGEAEASEYLQGALKDLPQDLRNQALVLMLNQAVVEESQEQSIARDIQESGVEAMRRLEDIEKRAQ